MIKKAEIKKLKKVATIFYVLSYLIILHVQPIPQTIAIIEKSVQEKDLNQQLTYIDDFLAIPAFFPGDTMSIALGDMDNDGDLDAVVGTLNYSIIVTLQNKIYWNNGDGTWTEADEFGESGAWAVDVADFNGDGFLDVIVGNYGSFLGPVTQNYLYLNVEDTINGGRTFVGYPRFGGLNTTNAYIMDVNEDGYPDVIVPNSSSNYLFIHNKDGNETTPPTFTQLGLLGTGNTMDLNLVDLNNDGFLDALKGEYSGTSTYRMNLGGSTYAESNFTNYAVTTLTVGDMEPFDYNNDGHIDFVVGLHGQNKLYSNNGDGTFTITDQFGGLATNALVMADIDNNGFDDVIVANGSWGSSAQNYIFWNNGDGTWTQEAKFGTGSTYAIKVADINNDGRLDVIAGNWRGTDYIYLNGYYQNTKTLQYEIESPAYLYSWTNLNVTEDIPARTSIEYSIYEPDSNNNSSCLDETLLISPQESINGTIDISSIDTRQSELCIVATLETQNPSSTPTLNDFKVTGLFGEGGTNLSNNFPLKNTMSRLETAQPANHTIHLGTINGITEDEDQIKIIFDPEEQSWDLSAITINDIELEANDTVFNLASTPAEDVWGVTVNDTTDEITFTAPISGSQYIPAASNIEVRIGDNTLNGENQIINPTAIGEYEIHLQNKFTTGGGADESGQISIPIVDDDRVNIHGYLDTLMSFDIDTATDDIDCDAIGGISPCNSHSNVIDSAGYVVSLGEMTLDSVNKSGDNLLHSDGKLGDVNYIWFDLETNAVSGAVITVQSRWGGLYKDANNIIPSVPTSTAFQILPGSGFFGINYREGLINTARIGQIVVNEYCRGTNGDDYYCSPGLSTGLPVPIAGCNGPLDDGRLQFSVGATPKAQSATGTYTDQLTFIATATF